MGLDLLAIKSSFEVVKPMADEVVSYFYETLFSSYPESKALFVQVEMEKQKKALIASMGKIIDGLENLESLRVDLRALGGRHVRYGVKEEHYAMIGKSLIGTLRYVFKESWTSSLENQWILAIGFIADQMLEGAKQGDTANQKPVLYLESAPTPPKNEPPDLSQFVRQIARSILFKALEDEMDGEFSRTLKKRAASLLTQAIRDEADQIQMNFKGGK